MRTAKQIYDEAKRLMFLGRGDEAIAKFTLAASMGSEDAEKALKVIRGESTDFDVIFGDSEDVFEDGGPICPQTVELNIPKTDERKSDCERNDGMRSEESEPGEQKHASDDVEFKLPSDYPTLQNYDKEQFDIDGVVLCKYKGDRADAYIPIGVQTIGKGAFNECATLRSVYLPADVTAINGRPFPNCPNLEIIRADENNPRYKTENNCLIDRQTDALIAGCRNSVIPSYVKSVGSGAFYGCTGLKSVKIPDGVTAIDDYAFAFCTGLKSLNLPDSVTSINYGAFSGCKGLKHFTVPDKVVEIPLFMCDECTSLESVYIPQGVDSIGDWAFWNCVNLKSVHLPVGVIFIGDGVFYGCTSLTSANIPNTVEVIGDDAFHGCASLKQIAIPSSVKKFGAFVFWDCLALELAWIPESLKKDVYVEYCTQVIYTK